MKITPTMYINAVSKNGNLRVKDIVNDYKGKNKRIILVDRSGKQWERNFKLD